MPASQRLRTTSLRHERSQSPTSQSLPEPWTISLTKPVIATRLRLHELRADIRRKQSAQPVKPVTLLKTDALKVKCVNCEKTTTKGPPNGKARLSLPYHKANSARNACSFDPVP